MAFTRTQLWRTTKDYICITVGMAAFAFGFTAFILPEKVIIGGLSGLSSIVYFTTGIPVAITQYVINLLLLALAYRMVGKQFVVGTIFGATMISVFIGIFQPLFTEPFTSQPFMNIAIGGLICGFGLGFTFVHNGSSGGTDIVAAMISKRSNITIGRMMLYTDVFIIGSSYFIFHQIENVVFGYVLMMIYTYAADMVINTNRQAVQFTIFSPKWREIATAVNNEARRGCTVLTGMGWYSKHEVKVLLVMCRKIESVTVFRIIKSIDRDAFVTQSNVNGVYGKGFDEVKVKMKVDSGHSAKANAEVRANYVTPSLDDDDHGSPSGHPHSMA